MARFCLFFLILTALFPVISESSSTMEFTVLSGGNPAGIQKYKSISKSEFQIAFEYNDRGRGPKLASHILLNEKGVPFHH